MGTKPLRLKSLNQQQSRSTYSVLWDSSDSQEATLKREGYNNVRLSTIVTWSTEGDRHLDHLASIKYFLTKGTTGIDAATGRKKKFNPPCRDANGKGINSDYIKDVFGAYTAELTCGLSVWATVGDKAPFMVNGMVCRDLEPTEGIENRLYLWMVCGGYPGAFSLGMSTLKKETQERMVGGKPAYKGLCLTASSMHLIAVYERQGFQLTPNACRYPTTGRYSKSMSTLYKDRVKNFMCKYGTECDDEKQSRWADGLLNVGINHPRAQLPSELQGNPKLLTAAQKKERRNIQSRFWDELAVGSEKKGGARGFAEEWYDEEGGVIVPGDGIFMDMCFSV